ncbi:MAG: esterase-like activity of phytase family protein [Gillisia sp.]
MKKLVFSVFLLSLLTGCSIFKPVPGKTKITFLDDYIIPKDLKVDSTLVGGLSGIEYANGQYYFICDQPSTPRFYEADIKISDKKIDTVIVKKAVKLKRSSSFLKDHTLDLEAIRLTSDKNFIISSEGAIKDQQDPSIFTVTPDGTFINSFSLPSYFMASGKQHPRNNGVFEGLAQNIDHTGYWASMELPLTQDGPKAKLFPTKSPVRITDFDSRSHQATAQFVMELSRIKKIPWEYFAVNGVTDLLQYGPHQFLVLERAYSSGHGSNGNTIRIYKVNTQYATNTLDIEELKNSAYVPAEKTLIFDFKSIQKKLKENIIDNIEGMTFGPDLPNGHKTLLLISDNNFNTMAPQVTQVLLMEVEL